MNAKEERAYMRGHRAAMVNMMGEAARSLGYKGRKGTNAYLIREREQAIANLRRLCEEFGDNDWDDNLHLADIISKHLGRHLNERGSK